jgi:hypothetical protein
MNKNTIQKKSTYNHVSTLRCISLAVLLLLAFAGRSQTLTVTVVDSVMNMCNSSMDGSITVQVTGGHMPYYYFWSNFGGSNTNKDSNLKAGSYSVTVYDSAYLQHVTSRNVVITQPTHIHIGKSVTSTCSNTGSAQATGVTGGTPYQVGAGYRYLWSDANSQTSAMATGLAAGAYVCTVTDSNGCHDTANFIVPTTSGLHINFGGITEVHCHGNSTGAVTAAGAGGGGGAYTYTWVSGQTTAHITGLSAGTYTVTVNHNACVDFNTITITQAAAVSASNQISNVSCYGDSSGWIYAFASGGTQPYTYTWSPSGETGFSDTNLKAGLQVCLIQDKYGCFYHDSATVTQPATPVTDSVVFLHNACGGANNGSVQIVGKGGTSPYHYSWSNGKTSSTIAGLAPGKYYLTVYDVNYCSHYDSATIGTVVSSPPTGNITYTPVSCFGGSNGKALNNVSGGLAPYRYIWSNADTLVTDSNMSAQLYTCIISDANGCSAADSVTITQPAALWDGITYTSDCNASGGSAMVNVNGGTIPYTYSWSNSGTLNTINGLTAGNYVITITDSNMCMHKDSITISTYTGFTEFISKSGNCMNDSDGFASVITTGGTSPFTYMWNNGQTQPVATHLSSGTYTVTITDSNRCQVVDSAKIGSALTVHVSANKTTICKGDTVMLTASGASTYLWYTSGNISCTNCPTPKADPIATATYSVVGSNGACSDTAAVTITVNVCTGVPGINHAGDDITLYPNPASSVMYVQVDNNQKVLLTMYNEVGQVIWNTTSQGKQTINVPVDNLSAGLYLMRVTYTETNDIVTKKVSIVR